MPSHAIARFCGSFGLKAGESDFVYNAALVLAALPLERRGASLPEISHARFCGRGPRLAARERIAFGPGAPTALHMVGSRAHHHDRPPTFMVTALAKHIDWLTGDQLLGADDLKACSDLTVAAEIAKRRSLGWTAEVDPRLCVDYVSSTSRSMKQRHAKHWKPRRWCFNIAVFACVCRRFAGFLSRQPCSIRCAR